MANRSKSLGTSYESLVRDFLRDEWCGDIERLTLSGAADRGDIGGFRVGGHLITIECKYRSRKPKGEEPLKPAGLSTWVAEAEKESSHYGALTGVVVHKRANKGKAEDQFVTLSLRSFLDILHAASS